MVDLSVGYPYGISVHSIPDQIKKKDRKGNIVITYEKVRSLKGLSVYSDLNLAIQEFVELTHEKWECPAIVQLFKLGHRKAPDGVWEEDNEIMASYRVAVKSNVKPKDK